jgi:serine/threonine-protein kinase RsbW
MGDRAEEMVLNIPSDFKYLGAVDAAVQDLAREFAFSQDAINDVSTALIEACSNAIEHGNKFGRDKRVNVTLKMASEAFVATVVDQGSGFDYDSALNDDSPPDMMSERGRGLLIMKAFTDGLSFSFDGGGLTVKLVKAREASADAGAAE